METRNAINQKELMQNNNNSTPTPNFKNDILTAMANIEGRANKQPKNEKILDKYIENLTSIIKWADRQSSAEIKAIDKKFQAHRISLNTLKEECGTYTLGETQYFWSLWFQQNFPFYEILSIGTSFNNKEMTQIKLTKLGNQLLFGHPTEIESITLRQVKNVLVNSTPADLITELVDNLKLKKIKTKDWVITPIHMSSLETYIRSCQLKQQSVDYNSNSNLHFKDTIDHDLASALMIQALSIGAAEKFKCEPALVQAPAVSEFGRTYLSGTNLQSCSKLVRHAAIGKAYQYDISACVYMWRNDESRRICKLLDIDFKPSHTLAYLDNKDGFRKHIAKLCFPEAFENNDEYQIKQSIKTAKQVLTSVGFGATAKNVGWYDSNNQYNTTAIKTLVKSEDRFKKLISDPIFSDFMKEQETISDILVEYHLNADEGLLKTISEDLALKLKSKSKKMAYLYQQAESILIELVKALAVDCDPELEILLTVHDAIYTNKKIDFAVIDSVRKLLYPSFKLEVEEINPWKDKNSQSQTDIDEEEHREFIRQQEVIAKSKYVPEVVEEPTKPAVDYSDCESLDDIKALDKEAAAVEIKEMLDSANPFVQAKRKWGLANSVDDEAESARRRAVLSKFSKKTDVTLMAE